MEWDLPREDSHFKRSHGSVEIHRERQRFPRSWWYPGLRECRLDKVRRRTRHMECQQRNQSINQATINLTHCILTFDWSISFRFSNWKALQTSSKKQGHLDLSMFKLSSLKKAWSMINRILPSLRILLRWSRSIKVCTRELFECSWFTARTSWKQMMGRTISATRMSFSRFLVVKKWSRMWLRTIKIQHGSRSTIFPCSCRRIQFSQCESKS